MEELKTLKEIAKCNIKKEVFSHECGGICGILTVKELKKEAIKWVKQNSDPDIESERNKGMVQWAKHFFNITEEDL